MVDVDGTLIDTRPLRPLILARDWAGFRAATADAAPNPDVVELVAGLARLGVTVVLATARPQRWEDATHDWAGRHGVAYHAIYCRGDRDHRPACVLKLHMAQELEDRGMRVVAAVDDRPSCVAAYHRHGVRDVYAVSGWRDPGDLEAPVTVDLFRPHDVLPIAWRTDDMLLPGVGL